MVQLIPGGRRPFSGAIDTVEMHAGGEPVRIVTGGYPAIPGGTILDKRRYARDHLDHLRTLLIFEPRGHEVIALGRYAVDRAIVAAKTPVTHVNIQCPCGLVRVHVEVRETPDGFETGEVSFESVPCFAFALDQSVGVAGLGKVALDIGYGGAFYALVAAPSIGLDLEASPLGSLVDAADAITKARAAAIALDHPGEPDLAFLYGTIITDGRDACEDAPTRNICIFADRQVDRSPTGSGVSATMAVQVARNQIGHGRQRRFERVTGAVFSGRAAPCEPVGRFDAVRVTVGGRAFYSGTSRFYMERQDELASGFLIR